MWQPIANAYNTVAGWFRRGLGNMSDALTQNKPAWPPEAERERLLRYERNTELYVGNHRRVFTSGTFGYHYTYDRNRDYVAVNLCGALTDTLIWRLFGEGVEILAPEGDTASQQFIDDIYHECNLDTVLLTAGAQASYLGDAFLKVRYDADESRVVIEPVLPSLVFPEFAPLNASRMIAATIAQVLHRDERHAYLWQERHELREGRGWIVNRLYKLAGSQQEGYRFDPRDDQVALTTLEATAQLPEEQETGVGSLLVVHVPNRLTAVSPFWGTSDYEGLIDIQGELNNRRTQRAEVLDKFVDPFMWGPPLSEESEVHLREHKYFETEAGAGSPVGMLVWDAQLPAVVEELRDLTEQFATSAGIEPEALQSPEGGGPQSGRAIRLSQYKTGAKVQAKQLYWGPVLRRVFSLATELANVSGVRVSPRPAVLAPADLVIRWNDGLPNDDREETEIMAMQVQAGLNSRLAAIQHLHGITEEGAQQRLAQIEAEERANAPEALGLTRGIQALAPGGE